MARHFTFLKSVILIGFLGIFLTSCGGGGGGEGGVFISGELSSYADGEGPSEENNAIIEVYNDYSGAVITNATVHVNGVRLYYNAVDQNYEGTVAVSPGDSVTVTVTVQGSTYRASGTQFTSYPKISTPTSGAKWPINCVNRVRWSTEAAPPDAFYGLGVIDATSDALEWPYYGYLHTMSINTTSYTIQGSDLNVGDKFVLVGIATSVNFENAAYGSAFYISGFDYAPVTVADFTPPPVSISVSPSPVGIALRESQQFTAMGTYCDGLTQDLTASVTWSSSDNNVAAISNTAGSQGKASAVYGGSTTITAESDGVSGSVTLTVYPYFALPINASWPAAVAVGDVTGDGKNDVVVVSDDDQLFLFEQNSVGELSLPASFVTAPSYISYFSVAIGDVNNDGKNEVVVTNSGSSIQVFEQDGNGGLISTAIYTTVNSTLIKIADLNHDGRSDVVGIGWGGDEAEVYLQNASGTLNAPVTYIIEHTGWDDLETGDINNDGLVDIIVKGGEGAAPRIGVLTQRADGSFNAAVYYSPSGNIGVGDVNGDGRNDVVVTSAGLCVMTQNIGGTLNSAACDLTYASSGAIDVGDVNADGRKDVVFVHYGYHALGIYFQAADGSLSAEQVYKIPYGVNNPHSLAIGDINSDGVNDIITLDRYHGLIVVVP